MPQKSFGSENECGRLVVRQQPSWLPVCDAILRHDHIFDSDAQNEYSTTKGKMTLHYYVDNRDGNQDVIVQMLNDRIK